MCDGLGEQSPLPSKAVDVGGSVSWVAVTTEVVRTKRIYGDQDNINRLRFFINRKEKDKADAKKKQRETKPKNIFPGIACSHFSFKRLIVIANLVPPTRALWKAAPRVVQNIRGFSRASRRKILRDLLYCFEKVRYHFGLERPAERAVGIFSPKRTEEVMKKDRLLAVFAVLAVVALVFLGILLGARRTATEPFFDRKIVVLGMDALDPRVIEPLIRAGKLPNFARLKEQGSYSPLSTTNPAQSPVAWAAFATGKNPGQNRVFDFIRRDPETYGLELAFSKMEKGRPAKVLKSKGFWNYTSERKIPTIVLSCPDTFPPDKVYGKMLSGMGVPDILGTQGTFTFYTSESARANKEIGGRVVQIKKEKVVTTDLVGPRKTGLRGEIENARVPLKLILLEKGRVRGEYQRKTIELEAGQWSDWNEVEFDLSFFRKTKGIFKAYLVSTEPEIRLYVSPINFDPRKPFFPISFPGKYSRELARDIGLYYTQGMPNHVWALNEDRLSEKAFLQQAGDVLKERRAMLGLELSRLKGGILFCYFETIDIIQHMFWRYADPQHPLYQKDAERMNEIEKWYVRMDEVLGDVLKKLNAEDALIVLSDHGFGTFRRAVHLNSWLRKKGYLALKHAQGASDQELLRSVDWAHTKAYALGFGGIYINQKGRESWGQVEPGEETAALKEQISKELGTWLDEPSQTPVVRKVYKQEDIFHGPYAKEAPDLYVGFNPGYRASWQTAMGGVPEGLVEDNLKKWSGDHLFDYTTVPGVIFSNRKMIRKDPSIYDVAPSILKEAGFSDEEIKRCDFDGKALFEATDKD